MCSFGKFWILTFGIYFELWLRPHVNDELFELIVRQSCRYFRVAHFKPRASKELLEKQLTFHCRSNFVAYSVPWKGQGQIVSRNSLSHVWKTDDGKVLPGTANNMLGKVTSRGNFCSFNLSPFRRHVDDMMLDDQRYKAM